MAPRTVIPWASTSLPNSSSAVPVQVSALQQPLKKPPLCTATLNSLCWERGFQQGETLTSVENRGSTCKVLLYSHWCLHGLRHICLWKEAKGGCVSVTKVRCRGQLRTWGAELLFCACIYCCFWKTLSGFTSEVWSSGEPCWCQNLRRVGSCTVASRPANADKITLLRDLCQEGV